MTNQLSITTPHVAIKNNQAITTSQAVADYFGKLHKDVIRRVKSLDCSPEFTGRNFALCFKNSELQNGKPQPYYQMTKDGFVFLVMGFTGKKAAVFKEAYINEFNRMEAGLHTAAQPSDHFSRAGKKVIPGCTTITQRKPLRLAICALVSKCGISYSYAYKLVHQQFRIKNVNQLQLPQVAQAVSYINECMGIRDMQLPAPLDEPVQPVPATQLMPYRKPSQREYDAYNINLAYSYVKTMATAWEETIKPVLKKLDSPLAGKLHDDFISGACVLWSMQRQFERRLEPGETPRIS